MTDQTCLKPGATIGMLGGGQLGRMMALEAARLGYHMHIYCPDEKSPAFEVAGKQTCAAYDDRAALEAFARDVDVITYEFENVPAETAEILNAITPVLPGAKALQTSQDRLVEKDFMTANGIAVAPYRAVDSLDDLQKALQDIGVPAVLKTRRFGYDGKGQVKIDDLRDAAEAYQAIGQAPAILEGFVPFTREVSIIAARGQQQDGEIAAYDLAENEHENHILKWTHVPARVEPSLNAKARKIAETILKKLDYIGVMGVEFFVVEQNGHTTLIVNEIAPRVHNSGHWTESACYCSQFAQHMRAIIGFHLGSTERHSNVVMENLIGEKDMDFTDMRQSLSYPGEFVHLYGKDEARPGRKMGHVNRLTPRTK